MKKLFLLSVLIWIFSNNLFAQKKISGTIADETGEPLVSATIVIKGTNQGVLTDFKGNYSISVPNNTKTLVMSFVGFQAKEVELKDNSKEISASLTEGLLLQVVNIIGYETISCTRCPTCENSLRTDSGCFGCCGCFCTYWVQFITDSLLATPLSNGSIKLDYSYNEHWKGQNKRECESKEGKKIYYDIFKSADDFHVQKIGNTYSDNLKIENRDDSTFLKWGESLFIDKTPFGSDSTYYLVEGYTMDEDEDSPNFREKEYVYRRKASIKSPESLIINNLYIQNAANVLELNISSPNVGDIDFAIIDMSGRIVTRHKQNIFEKNNVISMHTTALISGVYILTALQGEQLAQRKFVFVN